MSISAVIFSSKCYSDVATFLEDYQPRCLALVLADRGVVVVGVVMVMHGWW